MNPVITTILSKITKARLAVAGLLLIVIVGVFWLSSHSFIEVIVNNPGSGDYTYQIFNEFSGVNNSSQSNSSTIKKLVSKGAYEVLVSQAGQNYFGVVKAGGFLGTTKVAADLHAENARSFVGNNPGSCFNFLNQTLLSSACNSLVGDLSIHLPATDSQPTSLQRINNNSYAGYIESVFGTKEGSFILGKTTGGNDVETAPQFLYGLDGSFSIVNKTDLGALDGTKSYLTKPFKDGFIIYESGLSQVIYYSSAKASPSYLAIDKPKTDNLLPVSLAVNGNKISLTYAHGTEASDKNPASEVIVSDGQKSSHYSFTVNYGQAVVCGDHRLCMVGRQQMDVYDTSASEPKLLYSVSHVLSADAVGGNLLLGREKDILNFDVAKQSGYVSYSLGDYGFVGLQTTDNNYILSLAKPDQKTVALLVDRSSSDKDSIDKKLLDIERVVGVNAVSIYGQRVFISPNAGSLVVDPATGQFGYDPATLKAANDRISQGLVKIGLDQNSYKVVTTL